MQIGGPLFQQGSFPHVKNKKKKIIKSETMLEI